MLYAFADVVAQLYQQMILVSSQSLTLVFLMFAGHRLSFTRRSDRRKRRPYDRLRRKGSYTSLFAVIQRLPENLAAHAPAGHFPRRAMAGTKERRETLMNRPIRLFRANSIAHGCAGSLPVRRQALCPRRGSAKQTRRQFVAGMFAAAGAAVVAPARADEPLRWQIGCYTRPWAAHDYRAALDGIAVAGFKYVGLMTAKSKNNLIVSVATTPEEAAAVGAEVKQRGLKVISLWGGQFPTDGPAGLKRLIDNSAACGCPHLMLGGTSEKLHASYYKIVADCCDYARASGVGLSVKPHGGSNASGAQCRKVIEQVGHKNFRIWYDPGNVFFYSDGKLDPVDDAAAVDGVVIGMSVKDFRPPRDVELTPGAGKVDFAKVLARLQQGGFTRGPLVVECLAAGDVAHLKAEAVKARRFLENLTGQKA
jgi:sugar phosphate isomerase/epimerase